MEADKNRKVPKTDYHTKYNHIISLDVGKQAAQDVSANKQYGNGKYTLYICGSTWSVNYSKPMLII